MAQRVLYNARNGEHLTRDDPDYLPPGPEGKECRNRCELAPHYLCTRKLAHDNDCAAHGWVKWFKNGTGGRTLVMFARWSKTER